MFKRFWLSVFIVGAFLSQGVWAAPPSGAWVFPVIKDSGAMHPLPHAAFQPDKTAIYRVVFSVTHEQKQPQQHDYGLEPVARAVNIFASAGVHADHLKFVAVVSGEATPLVLDNAHYKKQFGTDNPNIKIIRELKAAGVEIVVCGQAVAGAGYQNDWIDPDVKVALSALSTLVILQHQGYALISL